jgi:hypothetical protein
MGNGTVALGSPGHLARGTPKEPGPRHRWNIGTAFDQLRPKPKALRGKNERLAVTASLSAGVTFRTAATVLYASAGVGCILPGPGCDVCDAKNVS